MATVVFEFKVEITVDAREGIDIDEEGARLVDHLRYVLDADVAEFPMSLVSEVRQVDVLHVDTDRPR